MRGVPKALVAIDEDRSMHPVANPRDKIDQLRGAAQPEIGGSQLGHRDHGTANEHRLCPGLFGDKCRQRVIHTRSDEDRPLTEPSVQGRGRVHCPTVGVVATANMGVAHFVRVANRNRQLLAVTAT